MCLLIIPLSFFNFSKHKARFKKASEMVSSNSMVKLYNSNALLKFLSKNSTLALSKVSSALSTTDMGDSKATARESCTTDDASQVQNENFLRIAIIQRSASHASRRTQLNALRALSFKLKNINIYIYNEIKAHQHTVQTYI